MCSICKLFKKQDSKIREESRHIYAENSLSTLAKERIEKILKEQAG
jgi:hypothetical protein